MIPSDSLSSFLSVKNSSVIHPMAIELLHIYKCTYTLSIHHWPYYITVTVCNKLTMVAVNVHAKVPTINTSGHIIIMWPPDFERPTKQGYKYRNKLLILNSTIILWQGGTSIISLIVNMNLSLYTESFDQTLHCKKSPPPPADLRFGFWWYTSDQLSLHSSSLSTNCHTHISDHSHSPRVSCEVSKDSVGRLQRYRHTTDHVHM